MNAVGEVVLRPARAAKKGERETPQDRFDAVRGRADVRWRPRSVPTDAQHIRAAFTTIVVPMDRVETWPRQITVSWR